MGLMSAPANKYVGLPLGLTVVFWATIMQPVMEPIFYLLIWRITLNNFKIC